MAYTSVQGYQSGAPSSVKLWDSPNLEVSFGSAGSGSYNLTVSATLEFYSEHDVTDNNTYRLVVYSGTSSSNLSSRGTYTMTKQSSTSTDATWTLNTTSSSAIPGTGTCYYRFNIVTSGGSSVIQNPVVSAALYYSTPSVTESTSPTSLYINGTSTYYQYVAGSGNFTLTWSGGTKGTNFVGYHILCTCIQDGGNGGGPWDLYPTSESTTDNFAASRAGSTYLYKIEACDLVNGSWVGRHYAGQITLKAVAAQYTATVSSANTSQGTVSGGGSYASGQNVTLTATPATGYHFVQWTFGGGWSGTSTTNPLTKAMVGSNVTATASFALNTYTISYNKGSNGTGTNTTDTKTHGTALTLKGAIFTRTGYTQTGWSTSDGGSKAYNLSASYTTNAAATLYPFWTANTYTVTLNQQSGSGGTSSVTATYNSAMPSATMPTRTGYTFGGYYTGTGGSGTQYYTATGASARTWNLTSATTLYAKWTANTYTVTLNANNGSGGTGSVTATYDSAMPAATMPSRTGYTFAGYYDTSATTGGTQYYTAAGASARTWNKTAATILYARWTAKTYTVSVNLMGGSGGPGSSFTATYGTNTSLTAPTRAGYDFVGWACASGSRLSQDYSACTGFFATVPTAYIWGGGTNNSTLTSVAMDTNSGFPNTLKMLTITEPGTSAKGVGWYRGTTSEASKVYLQIFIAKAPMGTYFMWTSNQIGTGASVEWLTPQAGTGKWQTYAIKITTGSSGTFSTFGHTVVCGNSSSVAGATNPGNITANVAWASIGLYSKYNATCTYVPADISSDTIYAVWIEKKYSISYNLNGGTQATAQNSVYTYTTNGVEAKNPTTAQWNRSPYIVGLTPGGSGKATANSPSYWYCVERPTKAATTSTTSSTITTSFSANGGSGSYSNLTSTKTTSTTTPQNFYSWTITGMDSSSHVYWGRANSGITTNSSQVFTSTSITLTADNYTGGVPTDFYNLRQTAGTVTFTAGWTPGTSSSTSTYTSITLPSAPGNKQGGTETHTVTFNANGGTCTVTGATFTATAEYTFGGWTTTSTGTSGMTPGSSYTPTSSATLYAAWSSNAGSSVVSAVTAPVPTRNGYVCTGWYTEEEGGTRRVTPGGSYTPPVNGETLFAQWASINGVWVYNGTEWKLTIPYVYTGSSWKATNAYVYDGSTWVKVN